MTEAYYGPFQQGRVRHPSESVLQNLAKAPHLDGSALQHLQQLVGLGGSVSPTRSSVRERGLWVSAIRSGERRGKLRSKRRLRRCSCVPPGSDRDEATRRGLLRSYALHMINIRRRSPGPNQLLTTGLASIPLLRILTDPVASSVESSVDVRADDLH